MFTHLGSRYAGRMARPLLLTALAALTIALASCDGNDDEQASTATPATSPAPTATVVSGSVELTVGAPIDFPEDLALIIATGCWQCDGPTTSVTRLRRTATEVEERILFGAIPVNGNITGIAFDVATGSAAVSTCAPNCSGLGEITGTEQTVVHLSTDNGASFTASPLTDGWFTISGYADGDLLISGPFDADDAPNPVSVYPGLERIFTPSGADWAYPMRTGVLWTTRERDTILAADGTTLFVSTDAQISEIVSLEATGNRIAVLLFSPEDPTSGAGYRLSIVHREEATLRHERTLTGRFIHAGAALDDCTIVANAELPAGTFPTPDTQGAGFAGFLPSIIDICDGIIHPIVDPFTRAPYLSGRNLIVAVQRGPFLAVAGDVGDCLNVRESPSTDAPSLGCFAAGVLLYDLEESTDAGGLTWRRVATPSGDEGWASDQFLSP
jgi:hypothetical protein